MPIARLSGVEVYYEETGAGVPLVWSHEFGGDHRSWEPQVRYFARGYRVVTYNHRGYAPSSVPVEAGAYSQDILVEDLFRLLRHTCTWRSFSPPSSAGAGRGGRHRQRARKETSCDIASR
jgi:pimeloyl-ACP methyl ester carboxylesterase